MNVYRVTVSEICRKSPRKLFDFVVQCNSDLYSVNNHFNARYHRLNVVVEKCEVLKLDEVKEYSLPF